METIQNHKSDQSASTRVAVWMWTWEYAKDNPFGGGFEAYIQNSVRDRKGGRAPMIPRRRRMTLAAGIYERTHRASVPPAYFQMLGEQGYRGLASGRQHSTPSGWCRWRRLGRPISPDAARRGTMDRPARNRAAERAYHLYGRILVRRHRSSDVVVGSCGVRKEISDRISPFVSQFFRRASFQVGAISVCRGYFIAVEKRR